jgi:hypothetical protein
MQAPNLIGPWWSLGTPACCVEKVGFGDTALHEFLARRGILARSFA